MTNFICWSAHQEYWSSTNRYSEPQQQYKFSNIQATQEPQPPFIPTARHYSLPGHRVVNCNNKKNQQWSDRNTMANKSFLSNGDYLKEQLFAERLHDSASETSNNGLYTSNGNNCRSTGSTLECTPNVHSSLILSNSSSEQEKDLPIRNSVVS